MRLMTGANPARTLQRRGNSTLRNRHHQLSAAAVTADRMKTVVQGTGGSLNSSQHTFSFYPHDAMLARVIAIATCPSVRHAPVLCQNEES